MIAAMPTETLTAASFEATASDAQLFDRFLRDFVPPDWFDAHAHLYRVDLQGTTIPPYMASGPAVADLATLRRCQRQWMGDRVPRTGLYFPIPYLTMDAEATNRFICDEVARSPGSRWLMLARPKDDPSAAERTSRLPNCVGFKVYHVFAGQPRTHLAELETFLPEWVWELSNARSLSIMLHMVKARSVADEANQRYIREHCIRYPNAKLILAHAARGFCGRHTVEGIGSLRGLDNVFFDTSAICESEPIEAILKTFGPSRLMVATDFPVSEIKGRAFCLGDGFLWLNKDSPDVKSGATHDGPSLIGVESLLAVKQACTNFGLRDGDIEQIFANTARQVLGIDSPDGSRGQQLYLAAKRIIPGGGQLLSKRPENYAPDQWPAYFAEAHGCETVDLDGRRFIDMSTSGIGSTLLGFADPDVTAAVVRRVQMGSMSTLNSPDEIELARMLLQMHPWAQMARFARGGGEAMAVAVRIARARTRRDAIAFCGYHGWHDWYLAANLTDGEALSGYHLLPGLDPAGVPRGLAGTMHPFNYNRLDELKRIVDQHGHQLAAIVMEPTRDSEPAAGFLAGARELAQRCGAVLIFDEITCGFRLHRGGAHLKYGIHPDMAVFGKALGSGHAIASIIGTTDVMQAAQSSFISSTMWTEGVGFTAGVATLKKFLTVDVPAHVARIGSRLRDGLRRLAEPRNLPLRITGPAALTYFAFDHSAPAALQTLWTVRMLHHGFLASAAFYPTLAHETRHVDAYLRACETVFDELADAIAKNDVESRIGGPVKLSGFRRLT